MDIKINYLSLGGMFKPVDNIEKIDLDEKVLVKENGIVFSLQQIRSPLYLLRGGDFYKKITKLFFIPISITIVLLLLAAQMLLFSSQPIWLKLIYLVPFASLGFYVYDSATTIESRSKQEDWVKYALILPYAVLLLCILSMREGYILTTMFLVAFSAFIVEEYAIKDLKTIISKGTTFWKFALSEANQDETDEIKALRKRNLDDFYIFVK